MLSERKWQLDGVLRMLLGIFGTWFVVQMIVSMLNFLIQPGAEPSTTSLLHTLFKIFLTQAIALCWVIYFLRDQKLNLRSAFGFVQRVPKAVMLGLLIGICVVPIAWMLQFLSVQLLDLLNMGPESQPIVSNFRETQKSAEANLMHKQVLFGISVTIIAPIVEEFLFRGIFYPTLRNLGFRRIGMWVTAILFGLMHGNMAGMIPLTLLGVVLVLVYEETDNLIAPILVHSVFNGTNFLYMLFEAQFNKLLFPS